MNAAHAVVITRILFAAAGILFLSAGVIAFILAVSGRQLVFYGGLAFVPLGVLFLTKLLTKGRSPSP